MADLKTTGEELSRPNIIIILVDDMGFSDLGCYGSEIHTPNLDGMAQRGIRFTQMYNCARCCPTRASLLTGLYPHQAGVGHMVGNHGTRAYQGYLREDCVTIAEALGAAGYQTCMSGKWHVGGGYVANRPETWMPGTPDHPLPVQRGFQRHYGMVGGGGSYFNPPYMVQDDRIIHPGGDDYYLTDAISDQAVAMIAGAAQKPEPFFLYVAYTAPHWPLHALPEDIAKYEGRYRQGWDALRTGRHEELKGLKL
ncbi:MAG: sulfatase-like hydrolase/transferase, partial [Anaerolineae bacterium]|nr:sulfatase-like hydrolase/transferase [Anaerolineae bacterium]